MMYNVFLYLNGNALLPQQFRQNYLLDLCGEYASHEVLSNLMYQLFSAGYSKKARYSLIKFDTNGREYIEFDDFGVYLKVYCSYSDSFCKADIVICKKTAPQPK